MVSPGQGRGRGTREQSDPSSGLPAAHCWMGARCSKPVDILQVEGSWSQKEGPYTVLGGWDEASWRKSQLQRHLRGEQEGAGQ